MIKAVVIGAGAMGLRHIQAVKKAGLDLVGVCDLSKEALAKTGLPEDVLFTDSSKCSGDLFVIATTAPSHLKLVETAIANGAKYILCEKPLATSSEDAEKIVKACEKAGVKLAVNHQTRFINQYKKVKELSSDFGKLSAITVNAGNFGIAMNVSHLIEMLRFISDSLPTKVNCWLDAEDVPNPRGEQFIDKAGELRIVTDSGAVMYVSAKSSSGHGIFVTYTFEHGQIFLDYLAGVIHTNLRKSEHRTQPATKYAMPADWQSLQIKSSDIVEITAEMLQELTGGSNYPDGEIGKMIVDTLVAAHNSDGKEVVIKKLTASQKKHKYPWA
jgi:predicted dehydrogenase